MTVTILDTDVWLHECGLRIPFSFGVTTLQELSQAFVAVTVEVDGTTTTGIAADNLVPRWFSKDPDASPEEDVAALEGVIRRACDHARDLDGASTPFAFWRALYDRQRQWAESTDHPPLVWGLGVSLIERGLIDGFCRATGTSFHDAVHENTLGVRPGTIYEELAGTTPSSGLPTTPRSSIQIRHTVGFEDPLTAEDVDRSRSPENDGPAGDGLPHALDEIISTYGVSHFKVKLGGAPKADASRLRRVANVVTEQVEDPVYTLDANEQYDGVSTLRTFRRELSDDEAGASLQSAIAFTEQPFPRESSLDRATGEALSAWDGPPVIIDESDDRPDALGEALARGYAGTSHKNCKGIFKSLVNACLLEKRRSETDREYVFSAEDLTTTGPVALPQDLAVVATLGIDHAERNGHHYLRGLDGFPEPVQEAVLDQYPRLYRRHSEGYPTLAIEEGAVDVRDVTDAPFGVHYRPERSTFE